MPLDNRRVGRNRELAEKLLQLAGRQTTTEDTELVQLAAKRLWSERDEQMVVESKSDEFVPVRPVPVRRVR